MTTYFSNFITLSRLPIILGVVCIHAGYFCDYGLFYYIFGEVFGRIGVPLFFFISGYLFFQKYLNTKIIYAQKIKKRFFSLFIPYVLWNFFAFIIYCFVTDSMSLDQFFQAFWVVEGKSGHSPADGPLWFLRSLMIYSLLAPFFFLINNSRILSWISPVLVFLWIFDISLFKSGFIIGVVFYGFGAWFAITNRDVQIPVPTKKQGVFVVVMYVLGVIAHYNYRDSSVLHNMMILMGFLLIYCIPVFFQSRKVIELGSLSFGLYCMHEIVLEVAKVFNIIPLVNGNFKYIVTVLATFVLCVCVCVLLQKINPKAAQLLLGYRRIEHK